jgi:DNA-directed RNA polymerase specialized sigma subunit
MSKTIRRTSNMDKKKVMALRVAQTAGKTVDVIAREQKMNPEDVESKLIELGYVPIYATTEQAVQAEPTEQAKHAEPTDSRLAETVAEEPTEELIVRPKERKKATNLTDEQKSAAVDDYLGGMSRRQVCNKYGISSSTLNRLITETGCVQRKRA